MTDDQLAAVRRSASKQREWAERRDQNIRDAIEAGHSLRAVADAAGMHFTSIRKIANRER